MDKEKQIEEMAKDYYGYSIDLEEDCKFVAEEMYDKGHRKINENEVVISKEEFERLKSQRYIITPKQVKSGKVVNLPFIPIQEYEIKPIPSEEEIRKETAEKILKGLYCLPHEYHEKEIEDLAKEFGVEIKE